MVVEYIQILFWLTWEGVLLIEQEPSRTCGVNHGTFLVFTDKMLTSSGAQSCSNDTTTCGLAGQ